MVAAQRAAPIVPRRRRPIVPYAANGVTAAAAVTFVVALGIYLRTMLPGVGFWDTAEAQTVPPTLSIFHPTGFPTYAMLGWLWSQLPLGEVAWRMNLLSGVAVALAAALVVLVAGHLIEERHRGLRAVAAGIAGLAFAFAAEPWENALRADVHALNVFFAALVLWLLFTWAAAERARRRAQEEPESEGPRRPGAWLAAAALAFGIGLGNHPLVGLLAPGIAVWLLVVDPGIWRRWRLGLLCVALLAIGLLGTYAYIPIRAAIDPEPPLFYARPDTWERFRYLVFAEQFHDLFDNFEEPLAELGTKWVKAESVLGLQFFGPGWLVIAFGAAVLAIRRSAAFVFLAIVVVANVLYSMNFQDGDIDRYYMVTVAAVAPILGVAVAALAATAARAVSDVAALVAGGRGLRLAASAAGGGVLLLALLLPAGSLVTLYERNDRSGDRDAARWVASVHEALPPNAVVVSWWSYSTPLWYHRWVLGERPDVLIIDDRDIIDDRWVSIHGAIRRFLGERPVYVVPANWHHSGIVERYETRIMPTYAGYTRLLEIVDRQ